MLGTEPGPLRAAALLTAELSVPLASDLQLFRWKCAGGISRFLVGLLIPLGLQLFVEHLDPRRCLVCGEQNHARLLVLWAVLRVVLRAELRASVLTSFPRLPLSLFQL